MFHSCVLLTKGAEVVVDTKLPVTPSTLAYLFGTRFSDAVSGNV